MKLFNSVVLIGLLIVGSNTAWAQPWLTPEPELASQVCWDVHPNGLLSVGFDADGNGKADRYSLRIVVRSGFSPLPARRVRESVPARLVFYSAYESENFYYIVMSHPLFYAVDVDEDGHWDLTFKDPAMDGVNGNEVFYESPSGMFPRGPQ